MPYIVTLNFNEEALECMEQSRLDLLHLYVLICMLKLRHLQVYLLALFKHFIRMVKSF